jgi:hypothetical protein
MAIIRTSSHIRTHRVLRTFRSCVNATGKPQILPDHGRVNLEECHRLNRTLQAGFHTEPRKSPLGA